MDRHAIGVRIVPQTDLQIPQLHPHRWISSGLVGKFGVFEGMKIVCEHWKDSVHATGQTGATHVAMGKTPWFELVTGKED